MTLRKQTGKERPLAGAKIACCTHITAQTAVSASTVQLKLGISKITVKKYKFHGELRHEFTAMLRL